MKDDDTPEWTGGALSQAIKQAADEVRLQTKEEKPEHDAFRRQKEQLLQQRRQLRSAIGDDRGEDAKTDIKRQLAVVTNTSRTA